jgi:phage shock protein PspC (stress-responsive transcriptional regulator)
MEKRLTRPQDGAMIAGVCAGLGRYFDMDPTIVRIVFALLTLFGFGGLILYIVLWLLMPRDA